MFMNKKMLVLLAVLVPSIAFADRKDVCNEITKDLFDGKTSEQIATRIRGMSADQINIEGINLEALVISTTIAKGLPGTHDLNVVNACNVALLRQLEGEAKRRDGNRRRRTDIEQEGGGTTGGQAGGSMDLSPGAAELRSDEQAIAETTEHEKVSSEALTECKILEETATCALPSSLQVSVDPLTDIMAVPLQISIPLEATHCGCIEGKAKKEVASDKVRDEKVNNKKKELKELVSSAFSKKFINDYAAHLEDVRYFTVNALGVFSEKKEEQAAAAEKMICSKPEDYQTAIQSKCGSKMTPQKLNEKMEKIFSMLGQRSEGLGYLRKLNRRIMVNSSEDGKHKFIRTDFDATRNGMVKTDLNVRFADNIVASILKNDRTRKAIIQMEGTPEEGILQYITQQIRVNDKFLSRFLNKDILGERVYNEMNAQFKDPVTALTVFKGKLKWAMQVHPGFETLMKRKDIFDQTGEKMRRNSSSAIDALETDDSILKPDLVARCMDLKENLAQFVCTEEEDLVSSVPTNELRHLVTESGKKDDLLFADLAICKNGNKNAKNGVFTELVTQPYERQSDIIERLSKVPQKDQHNLFTKMLMQTQKDGNSSTAQYLASAAQEGFRNRRGILSDSFSSLFDVSESEKVSFAGKDPSSSSSSIASFNENAKPGSSNGQGSTEDKASQLAQAQAAAAQMAEAQSQQMINGYANYAAPVAQATAETGTTKTATSEKADMRAELREFLSNKDNQENVERLIKDADDKQLAEIARLRAETEKSKEQILQLANENEKLKLKQMQTELAALEEKRAKAVATNVAPAQTEETERSSGRGSREIASVSGETTGSTSTAAAGGVRGVATSGSGSVASGETGTSGGKSGGLSGLRNELSNGLGGNEISGGSAEPVVISSAQSRNGSIEIKSTELSNEILNFLESEPDVQTLIKMRNSGMVYKYKIVENGKEVQKEISIDYKTLNENVKKLIDQKIADSGRAGSEAQRLSAEIRNLRRAYTYNSLKIILGEQLKRQ